MSSSSGVESVLDAFLSAKSGGAHRDAETLKRWEDEIVSMLEAGRYRFADEFLYSVLYAIQDDLYITDAQIRGIVNIKNSNGKRRKRRNRY